MKSVFRYMKKQPVSTRYGLIAQGIVLTIAGLIVPKHSTEILAAGVLFCAVALVLCVGAWRVTEVVEGEIVIEQQPQMPDARMHTQCVPELPQAA